MDEKTRPGPCCEKKCYNAFTLAEINAFRERLTALGAIKNVQKKAVRIWDTIMFAYGPEVVQCCDNFFWALTDSVDIDVRDPGSITDDSRHEDSEDEDEDENDVVDDGVSSFFKDATLAYEDAQRDFDCRRAYLLEQLEETDRVLSKAKLTFEEAKGNEAAYQRREAIWRERKQRIDAQRQAEVDEQMASLGQMASSGQAEAVLRNMVEEQRQAEIDAEIDEQIDQAVLSLINMVE
jgi:hypothetical protein